MEGIVSAIKDPNADHPIASAWRPALASIAAALARRDYGLSHGIAGVAPVSARVANQIMAYVASYGEALIELPDETWTISRSQWMEIIGILSLICGHSNQDRAIWCSGYERSRKPMGSD